MRCSRNGRTGSALVLGAAVAVVAALAAGSAAPTASAAEHNAAGDANVFSYYVPIEFKIGGLGLHQAILSCTDDVHIERLGIYVPHGVMIGGDSITVADRVLMHPPIFLEDQGPFIELDADLPAGSHAVIPILTLRESNSLARLLYTAGPGVSCSINMPPSGVQEIGVVGNKDARDAAATAAEQYNAQLKRDGVGWSLKLFTATGYSDPLNAVKYMENRDIDVILVQAQDKDVKAIRDYVASKKSDLVVLFLLPNMLSVAANSEVYNQTYAGRSELGLPVEGTFADGLSKLFAADKADSAMILYEGKSKRLHADLLRMSLLERGVHASTFDYSSSPERTAGTVSKWMKVWDGEVSRVVLMPAESPQKMLEVLYARATPVGDGIYTDDTYTLSGVAMRSKIVAVVPTVPDLTPDGTPAYEGNLLQRSAYGAVALLTHSVLKAQTTDSDAILSVLPGVAGGLMVTFGGPSILPPVYDTFAYHDGMWIK